MKKNSKNSIYNLLMILLAASFCFSGFMLYQENKNAKDEVKAYQQLEEYVENEIKDEFPKVDFEALLAINPDTIGWIYIPDTNVNYPVVQAEDNDAYLRRLFDGTKGNSGTIFLDAACDKNLMDRHSILYGHHMKNGTMFADVEKYKDQDYANEHSKGYYITSNAIYELTFFAGYVTDTLKDCWKLDFENDEEYLAWISEAKEISSFHSDYSCDATQRIMTLSTCSYDIEDGRFVLLAIIEEKQMD